MINEKKNAIESRDQLWIKLRSANNFESKSTKCD